MLQQRAKAAGRHHHQNTGKRQYRTGQGSGGQALAEADYRHGQRHQRHQRQNDPHVGGRRQCCSEIGQALINRHAEYAEDEDPPQVWAYDRPMGDHRLKHERREQNPGQQPAVEADFGGEDCAHREFVDHGVASPNEDGQQGISVLHREKARTLMRGNYPSVWMQAYTAIQTICP
ncbi:hypothetical protein SRABI130_05147 [Pseudomonas sp. Bi130]|nr:hypothetical protein SRABI130_05147 [Pseudomonas sp. Bi130]